MVGAEPGLGGWSEPVNLSRSPQYDNAPAVAASADGAVAIGWERRVISDPTANQIIATGNASLGGGFREQQLSQTAPQKTSGGVRMGHDALGRKHVVWWQVDGSAVCDYYARIEADGRTSILEKVPGTCGLGLKNTALAVGAGNSVHALFGKNLQSVLYWARTDEGWTVQGEQIPGTEKPEHLSVGVTTGGQVIAAWKDNADGGWTDIYSAARRGPGNWFVEDLTERLSPGCAGNSITYYPSPRGRSIGRDAAGVVRREVRPAQPRPASAGDLLPRVGARGRLEPATGAGGGAPRGQLAPKRHGRRRGGDGPYRLGQHQRPGHQYLLRKRARHHLYLARSAFRLLDRQGLHQGYCPRLQWGLPSPGFDSDRDDPQKETYYTYKQIGAPAQPPPQPTPQPQPPPPAPAPAPSLPPPVPVPGSGSVTFQPTGRSVSGLFLQYWNSHGGLPQQGYPISSAMGEVSGLNGKPYTVQYFKRAVFEYHPENQAPYDVLLSQLGTYQYKKKYPNGAPGQVPDHSGLYFPETGHWLGGGFKQFWQDHGGLPQQGYPISDQFQERSDLDGKTYIVQYFERSVIEWHPANQDPYKVLLSLLGVFQFRQKYGK